MNPRARRWLQRAVFTADRTLADLRTIRPGDPVAARFAEFGRGASIQGPQVGLRNVGAVAVEDDVEIRSYVNIEVIGPTDRVLLRFGRGAIIGHQVRFVVLNGIDLGEECGIGHGCTIADTVHDWQSGPEGGHPGHTPLALNAPLRVGARAWIGNNTVIMGGVTIGARAIVGANSVITRDIPDDTIVAGNPPRLGGAVAAMRRFRVEGE